MIYFSENFENSDTDQLVDIFEENTKFIQNFQPSFLSEFDIENNLDLISKTSNRHDDMDNKPISEYSGDTNTSLQKTKLFNVETVKKKIDNRNDGKRKKIKRFFYTYFKKTLQNKLTSKRKMLLVEKVPQKLIKDVSISFNKRTLNMTMLDILKLAVTELQDYKIEAFLKRLPQEMLNDELFTLTEREMLLKYFDSDQFEIDKKIILAKNGKDYFDEILLIAKDYIDYFTYGTGNRKSKVVPGMK